MVRIIPKRLINLRRNRPEQSYTTPTNIPFTGTVNVPVSPPTSTPEVPKTRLITDVKTLSTTSPIGSITSNQTNETVNVPKPITRAVSQNGAIDDQIPIKLSEQSATLTPQPSNTNEVVIKIEHSAFERKISPDTNTSVNSSINEPAKASNEYYPDIPQPASQTEAVKPNETVINIEHKGPSLSNSQSFLNSSDNKNFINSQTFAPQTNDIQHSPNMGVATLPPQSPESMVAITAPVTKA